MEIKDVFISYRRTGGATVARLLCDVLTQRNISIFFDKESLGEGNFDDAIEKNLQAARNFVLIVSPGLFERGKSSNGKYDPVLTEKDWVYREIRTALASGKPIIPIFVNGEKEFPTILPPGIEEIYRKDALSFGHDHFEPELEKLISRIKTRKDQLTESYIKNLSASYSPKEQCESLIEICESLGGNKATEEILNLIANKFRRLLNIKNNQQAINVIADTITPDLLKTICKDLSIDNSGDTKHIKSNMTEWITNKKFRAFSVEEEESDRINNVIDAFAITYRSHEKRAKIISTIEEETHFELKTTRNSNSIFCEIFEYFSVEEFLEEKSKQLSEEEIKSVSFLLFNNDKGRKKELIERIIDYANYTYHPEEHE
ncbi:toll/interleukin-1 receptor domain-containing protein [Stutzerimonas stutzeri]|uniref:toll/interleukin-1 receptor domain-containing protein n=1 Tax=Stutzerimonas stutzeri TaxID=316 RepID=UPI0015E44B95|nr:toll/interleukin-1 receptor domain-containing protein [Stutzerimonas stutzeri]MBA1265261.1 toll/interleukin-1 receptor domain-containing protein [Stutzerimonas stutzeri]